LSVSAQASVHAAQQRGGLALNANASRPLHTKPPAAAPRPPDGGRSLARAPLTS
jgi:hypothetical protein